MYIAVRAEMGDFAPGSVTLAMIPAFFALRDPFDRWYRLSEKLKSIALARISSVISSHHFICVIRVIFNENKSRITIHGHCSASRCVRSVHHMQPAAGMLH